MPSLRIRADRQNGARVRVWVSLGRPLLMQRRQAGLAITQPVEVTGVLDTGAERTCVDPGVVAALGLAGLGVGLVAAPGTGTAPVPGLGGSSAAAWYKVGLTLLSPPSVPGADLEFPEVDVDELPLSHFGVDVLIGRDVLAGCVLVYDGPAGSVTLAY
jgi:hypothetical protein